MGNRRGRPWLGVWPLPMELHAASRHPALLKRTRVNVQQEDFMGKTLRWPHVTAVMKAVLINWWN